jgi:hypothetical protein
VDRHFCKSLGLVLCVILLGGVSWPPSIAAADEDVRKQIAELEKKIAELKKKIAGNGDDNEAPLRWGSPLSPSGVTPWSFWGGASWSGGPGPVGFGLRPSFHHVDLKELSSWDLRDHIPVSLHVHQQSRQSEGWAFAAIGAFEANYAYRFGRRASPSVQYVLNNVRGRDPVHAYR